MNKIPERMKAGVAARIVAAAMSTLISYALLNRVAWIASLEDGASVPALLAHGGAAPARGVPDSGAATLVVVADSH